MSFPSEVKEKVLVACARHCCICHQFKGVKIELHHIKLRSEGGDNTFENCIPLCFDCHSEQTSYDFKHPKGTKYTISELIQHRDSWYARVAATPPVLMPANQRELDMQLLADVKSILPWNGAIDFIKKHSFGASFRRNQLDQLYTFLERCDDPSFEFLDAEMEALRSVLVAEIDVFLELIEANVFADEKYREFGVIPKEWDALDRNLRIDAVRKLNHQATRAGQMYDNLVRAGKRKLGV